MLRDSDLLLTLEMSGRLADELSSQMSVMKLRYEGECMERTTALMSRR